MSAFCAFRSAAISVLRPGRLPLACSRRVATFHSSRITLKKEPFDITKLKRKRIVIPEHNPIPKPRRGKKIKIPYVHLLGPGDVLGPLRPLEEILEAVNEDEYFVELVQEDPPTVKLVDIKESRAQTLLQRERDKRAAGVAPKDMHKEHHLTWSVEPGDEDHKLNRIREDLEKGFKVEVMYMTKKGHRPPPRIEMNLKLQEALKKLEVHAKEWKPPSVDARQGVLHLQTKKPKSVVKIPIAELKESIPKSVLERKARQEKALAKKRKAEEEQNSSQTQDDDDSTCMLY